mgnify:CR=1 FL=1
MGAPDFWDDVEAAQKITQEATWLKNEVETWKSLRVKLDDAETLWELAMEEDDASLESEIKEGLEAIEQEIERLELNLLLGGEYDGNNAILTIHAGAGGTEAQDWAQLPSRMYSRYAERSQFKTEILDLQAGLDAGIKSVAMQINGHNAFGFLKAEKSPISANRTTAEYPPMPGMVVSSSTLVLIWGSPVTTRRISSSIAWTFANRRRSVDTKERAHMESEE